MMMQYSHVGAPPRSPYHSQAVMRLKPQGGIQEMEQGSQVTLMIPYPRPETEK